MTQITAQDVEGWLAARGCVIVEDKGEFALVHPSGYGNSRAAHTLLAKDRDSALAEAWRFINPEAAAFARIATIKRVVAESFGTVPSAFLTKGRSEPLATARRIAIALCRDMTVATREAISNSFALETPSSVRYAVASVADQCATDQQFAARVGTLRTAANAAFVGGPTPNENAR